MEDYTLREMMTIVAAREIKNGDIVFSGTGIPMLAAMAAKNINAPDCVMFFETGAIDSKLNEIPLAVADSRVMYQAAIAGGLFDAFTTMQNPVTGRRVIGILGAAQIDIYGNLNTTVIGNYVRPGTRFPGSGGGCDVASFVPRCIIFMQQEKRRFVKKLDYLTSPGHLDGPNGRRKAGLREGGPTVVITDMGVFRSTRNPANVFGGLPSRHNSRPNPGKHGIYSGRFPGQRGGAANTGRARDTQGQMRSANADSLAVTA